MAQKVVSQKKKIIRRPIKKAQVSAELFAWTKSFIEEYRPALNELSRK